VDDNEQARLVAARVLGAAYRVATASTAEAALASALAEPPDVAVLDIHLGRGADGTEVMRRLREQPGLAALPVVAVTAYGVAGDRARYLALGFDDYVPKPFTRDELVSAVRGACERVSV
jgi:CheY-like chemotaxis protein